MNFYDVLAAKNWNGGIPSINFFDLLFAQSMGGGEQWQTYEGTLPATIISTGDNLRQYQVWGNTGGVGEEVDIAGLSEPLCGMGTYTDSLDLSTGTLTRRLKKLVLTGEENWRKNDTSPDNSLYYLSEITDKMKADCTCTHFPQSRTPFPANNQISANAMAKIIYIYLNKNIINAMPSGNTKEGFKEFLTAQYAAGTPVTVWYVLAQPEVSTITVPSGLTDTIEGYLIQDGTPTPETPIYPTANGVKQANDTYSIKYGYKLDMGVKSGNLLDYRTVQNNLTVDAATGLPVEYSGRIANFTPIDVSAVSAVKITYNINYGIIYFMYSILTADNTMLIRKISKQNGDTVEIPAGGAKLYISWYGTSSVTTDDITQVMVSVNPPDKYQPYSNTTTPIYIGDEPLDEDEYVDYTEQKIYRMINGTLTPTDPPVPLPALPTCEGETVVDYAGESVAPEKVLLEYAKGGS